MKRIINERVLPIKYLKFIFFLILSIIILMSSAISFASESKFFVDRVIAVVNREVITWSELYRYMEFTSRDEVKDMNPNEKFDYFKKREEEFLEKLIDTKLQIEEAERYGINVTDSEIDTAIKDIKSKHGLGDREFEESLKKEGMTFAEYKKMLKEQIIIGRVINSIVKPKIVVTDEEIKNFITLNPDLQCDEDSFNVSQIFIKMRENQEELKNIINEIMKKLLLGEAFNKIASQYSEDISAKAGGNIGLLKKREISPELTGLFSKMNVGQISEPLVTLNGIYIFRLDGICFKKDSNELKNYVKAQLDEQKFKKEYRLWIRSLRQRSYIEIME